MPVLEPSLNEGSVNSNELRFHSCHGENAVISPNGRVATRPSARGEFNDAIVVSSRPLLDNELFEVVVERMVDRWSGSIEAGQLYISVHFSTEI